MDSPRFIGPIVITRYLGPTNTRCSRIVASHHRDSETHWRHTIPWDHALNAGDNHKRAAEALLASWPLGKGAGAAPFVIIGRGHDHDAYYWLAVQPWQLQEAQS